MRRTLHRYLFVGLLIAAASVGPASAIPTSAPTADQLVYLAPSLPEDDLATLRRTAPDLDVRVGLSAAEALAIAEEVHGIDARYATSDFLAAATNLRWVQSPSAGVERYLRVPGLRESPRITFTNMQGVHGPTIADHVFAMLLTLTRDLAWYTHPDQRGTWSRNGSGRETIALEGRTLFVVGLGGIGREVAKRGKGFGMRVLATRRSDVPPPPYVDEQGPPDRLMDYLKQSDVVVICLPLTDETTGLFGAEQLAAMKEGSYLLNVGRGRIVETDALVEALKSGHLAGAGLDVTDPEPLPADHELWTMPNVVITPHVSSRSDLTRRTWRETYVENLRRFAAGEPLLNVVDKAAGY